MIWLFDYVVSSPLQVTTEVLFTLITWHCWKLLQKRAGLPPGPIPLPFIGTTYTFPRDMTQWSFLMAKMSEKYGSVFTHQLGNGMCFIVMTDPAVYRDVFAKSTDVAGRSVVRTRVLTQKILNPQFPKSGILFGDYDEQLKLQRNISMVVLRSLGYGKKSIENRILDEANHLVEAFKEVKGKSFSPKLLLDNAVVNIICSLLFDKRFDYSDSEFQQLQGDFDKIFEYNALMILVDYIWFFQYLPSYKKLLREFKTVCNRVHAYVAGKELERKESMQRGQDSTDFISMYLKEVEKSDGKLEDRSRQIVSDFFAAGSETTSTTLRWCLYFMAKYPQVQDKARAILNDVLGQGQKPTLKDRDSLLYIEATITEILRVAPTAPGSLPHSTIRDVEICGYKIPKGTQIQALFVNAIWDPVLFPEPDIVKPERHLDTEGNLIRNEVLTTFGVGRRSCLAEQLARGELFLFFTHLIQNFEFKVPEGETLPPQTGSWFITYRPPLYNLCAIPLK